MIPKKEVGQVGQTISYYKLLEKLGEVPNLPASALQRVVATLIPLCGTPFFGGSGRIQP